MPTLKEMFEHEVRLVHLSLKNFRGFGSLYLEFGNDSFITVLIANNGSGKTSILDAAANFLRYFLATGVLGREHEKIFFDTPYENNLGPKDIKNEQAVAFCEILLELRYLYPAKEIFVIMNDIVAYLNEYQISGSEVKLKLHESGHTNFEWLLFLEVEGEKNQNEIELPEAIINNLDQLLKESDDYGRAKLQATDEFTVAFYRDGNWQPNMLLSHENNIAKVHFKGKLNIQYELNKTGGRFITPNSKANGITDFIQQMEEGIAFLDDFFESAKGYSANNRVTILPLLAYYGGSAINTRFKEVSITYHPLPYQAYSYALEPERFDFEEFLEWFNSLSGEPEHIIARVKDAILEVLNAGEDDNRAKYNNLRIEKGALQVDKKNSEQEQYLPIEINQFSAGEKNLFALIGDLVKRAAQLNPLLFEVGYDPSVGSYSNPLEYTNGIVLIDEIDLHLHPKWQRGIVPKLRQLFPKVQFVVTTHSPLVLQEVDGRIINLNINVTNQPQLLGGWSIEQILQFMGIVETYGSQYDNLVDDFYASIRDENIGEAENIFKELERYLPIKSPFKTTLINRLNSLKDDW